MSGSSFQEVNIVSWLGSKWGICGGAILLLPLLVTYRVPQEVQAAALFFYLITVPPAPRNDILRKPGGL